MRTRVLSTFSTIGQVGKEIVRFMRVPVTTQTRIKLGTFLIVGWYIRVTGNAGLHASKHNESLYGRLKKVQDNEWKIPLKPNTLSRVHRARWILKHPLAEVSETFSEEVVDKRIGNDLSSWCVILTGTLSPHDDVDRLAQRSTHDRIESYRRSFSYWKNQTTFPLFFVDNSNSDTGYRVLRNEFQSNVGDGIPMAHVPLNHTFGNKGMGEKMSVFSALENMSSTLPDKYSSCTNILKVSGRFMPPIGLIDALRACPATTKLVVQRHRGGSYQPMESQLFGWPRGGMVEHLYQQWNGEETDIERYLFEILKIVGHCDPPNTSSKEVTSCKDVCLLGPLQLPQPVTRGGSGKTVEVV